MWLGQVGQEGETETDPALGSVVWEARGPAQSGGVGRAWVHLLHIGFGIISNAS